MLEFALHFKHNLESSALDEACEGVFARIKKERDNNISGYYNLPFSTQARDFAKAYINANSAFLDNISNLVIIGIGGSSLGLKAIDYALSHLPQRKPLNLIFLEHTDPIAIAKSLQSLALHNTLFVVISKSGTTIETSSLLKYVLHSYKILESSDNKKHLLAITDINSPLEAFAREQGISYINIEPNVGGRFSVLSSVGIVPLSLLGFNVELILKGAAELTQRFFNKQELHILQKALFYATNVEKIPMNVLFSYSSLFTHLNAWYVQLWGESLGKINAKGQKIGLTPIALIGSIDQHSFLQLIMQGKSDKSVTFLSLHPTHSLEPTIPDMQLAHLQSTNFVNNQSFAKLLNNQRIATMQSIENEGIACDCIEVMNLCEESIGALIAYFELLTSSVGAIFEVDTYNQPGVEYGKERLRKLFG